MPIVSKKSRNLRNKCEWSFPDSKKLRAELFTEESIIHPAKMDLLLSDALVEAYVKPGDVVCDLMSGIGTTGVSVLRKQPKAGGYIGVELEGNFAEMQAANLERQNSGVPWMVLHADASDVYEYLERSADAVLFSPPFGTMSHSMGKAAEDIKKKYPNDCHYSDGEDNIGNKRTYGNVDTILFSPPFANANTGGSLDNLAEAKISNRNAQTLSSSRRNIDNIKRYGNIDTVLFSPPFGSVTAFQDKNIDKWRRNGKKSKSDEKYLSANRYSEDKNNIGKRSGETYWDSMKWVYYSAHRLLKHGGVLITHTKNNVKNGAVVDLTGDTIRVIEALGFTMRRCPGCGSDKHTHRRVISNPSFWVNMRTKQWLEREENAGKTALDCPYYQVWEDICVFDKN